eukprot:g519.t1
MFIFIPLTTGWDSVGTVLVALSDSENDEEGDRPLWGDLICVTSAFFYASYTVLLKRQIPDTSRVDMSLLFGFMGLILFIAVSIIAILTLMFGFVNFTLSPTTGAMVVVKGLLDNVLSDFLWAKAVLLIGPTIATVGLSLQSPITFVIDIIFRHPAWMNSTVSTLLISFGSLFILFGFFGINISEEKGASLEDRIKTLVSWKRGDNGVQSSSDRYELIEKE